MNETCALACKTKLQLKSFFSQKQIMMIGAPTLTLANFAYTINFLIISIKMITDGSQWKRREKTQPTLI